MTPPIRATVVDVDLDAVTANVGALRGRGGELIAVVKADAYGHGAEAVGEAAIAAGAVMLAVATVEEAMVLRASGIGAGILVLLGAADRAEADAAVASRLTLTVWDIERAALAAEAARSARTVLPVHFKVDTGLTRLGSPAPNAPAAIKAIGDLAGLAVEGVYTHLASPDATDLASSHAQLAAFADFLGGLGEHPRWIHVLASAGVSSLGPFPGANAVRVGLALHGLVAAPHLEGRLDLRPTMEWRTRILRAVDVPKGTGLSYGHEYLMPRDGRVATLPVGYADGLPRSAGLGRAAVLVGGRAVPIAGRVSMDLITLDVSDLPNARAGDEAVLIGAQGSGRQTASGLAAACGTIAHEIVTGLRARVPRRYLRGGKVVATKTLAEGYVRC